MMFPPISVPSPEMFGNEVNGPFFSHGKKSFFSFLTSASVQGSPWYFSTKLKPFIQLIRPPQASANTPLIKPPTPSLPAFFHVNSNFFLFFPHFHVPSVPPPSFPGDVFSLIPTLLLVPFFPTFPAFLGMFVPETGFPPPSPARTSLSCLPPTQTQTGQSPPPLIQRELLPVPPV